VGAAGCRQEEKVSAGQSLQLLLSCSCFYEHVPTGWRASAVCAVCSIRKIKTTESNWCSSPMSSCFQCACAACDTSSANVPSVYCAPVHLCTCAPAVTLTCILTSSRGCVSLLQEWCPYMPLARNKPYLGTGLYVDGKKEDVHGAASIIPEVNQQELLQGGLGQLYRASSCVCCLQMVCCPVLLTACGWRKCHKWAMHAVVCRHIAVPQHSALRPWHG
jgi:hypothetical protein